jgi:hypothetical protein
LPVKWLFGSIPRAKFGETDVSENFNRCRGAGGAIDGQLRCGLPRSEGQRDIRRYFSDDTGGWAQPIDGVVPEPKVHLKAPNSGYVWYNNTFNASEGDYCIEFVWPKPLAPDNKAYVALAFWASDYANLYLVQVDSGGGINLWRKSGGTWATIGDLSNPKVKPVPCSLVTLRVVAKGNLIVPILDGVELKKTRAQMPAGNLKFGLFIQDDTAVPDAVFEIKRFKVTSGG